MSRVITVGAAQLGPIQKAEGRGVVVERMLALMHRAHAKGCQLVVFPELALTSFFPRCTCKRGETRLILAVLPERKINRV